MKASQNITRSLVLTVLSQLPAHLFGVLAGVCIARILGPEGKGVFAIFYANENLFRTVLGFTLANSIIYFVANNRISLERLKSIVSILVLSTMVLSVIGCYLWLNSKYDNLFVPDYEPTTLLLVLFFTTIFFSQVNTAFTAYFQGLRHFKTVNKVLLINSIFSVFIFFAAFYCHEMNFYKVELIDVIFLSVIVLVLSTLHWLFYYFKTGRITFQVDRNLKYDFVKFLKFAGMNHVAKILVFLNHRIILWFIALYLDNWHVGIFSIGMGLAYVLSSFSAVLESFLSAEKRSNQAHIFSIFSRFQFSIILLVCLLIILLSPYIVPWLYGEEFKEAVSVLNIVVVGILLSYQSGNFSSLFVARDQLTYNVTASILGVAITIVFAPFLIAKYGVIGAAYCQLFSYTAVFIFQYIVVLVKTDADTNLLFITRSDWKHVCSQLKTPFKKSS